jgi:hypothetical protein
MSNTARDVVHISRYLNRRSPTHIRDKLFTPLYRQKPFFTGLFITLTIIVVGLFLVTSPTHASPFGNGSRQPQNNGNTLIRRTDRKFPL